MTSTPTTPPAPEPLPWYDIAIIGAGAAGLTAAIFAADTSHSAGAVPRRIALLDGAKTVGAKILVSGGGRCNVTHDVVTPEDFNASRPIVRNVLAAFDEKAAARWFGAMGVSLKREPTGKLFPVSDSAKTVLAALLKRCADRGVDLRTSQRVVSVERADADDAAAVAAAAADSFIVRYTGGAIRARRVVLATGGRSLPRTGSDGGGWEIARRLGHTVADTFPALVPLVLEETFFHARVSGLSHEAELTTVVGNKPIDRRAGSLLWTHFGASGPVVMDASRHWVIARSLGPAVELRCAFLPGETFESVEQGWIARAGGRPRAAVSTLFGNALPQRLAEAILTHVGIDPALPAAQLTREARRRLVHALTGMPLPVARDRGWNYAEVTAGGIPLSEIDYRTMASRIIPGLYLAGEILDCDGRIGGFNFQWAWATGYLAGRAAASGIG